MSGHYSFPEENYYIKESVKQDPYACIQFNNNLWSVFFIKGNILGVGVQR